MSDMEEREGIVFDIKELSLYDGPGLRCTVFLKGCPMRCVWCHNPEGISPEPEIMRSAFGTRMVGARYTASALTEKIFSYLPLFKRPEDGITFSGGEPMTQAEFLADVMRRLKGRVNMIVQTSGYAKRPHFAAVIREADIIYFDLKIMDGKLHKFYTGVDNALILENLKYMNDAGYKYRIRVPLIPGVTDTPENYRGIRDFVRGNLCDKNNLTGLDLLPYNPSAGGKYKGLGREYSPGFDESRAVRIDPGCLRETVKEVKVL
jgi:pyruvate formate lyase activating enzyme